MREVERQVMLRIIDQRWREHLEEMDYLKEGINLRAMGQKDPLTEWQREGYEMFGAMMKGIAQDFVRYVMHVQVVSNDQQRRRAAPVQNRPSTTSGRGRSPTGFERRGDVRGRRRPAETERGGARPARRRRRRSRRRRVPPRRRRPPDRAARPAKQETVVKDEWSKTPRNAPCPCGSGKKFKMCHGAG